MKLLIDSIQLADPSPNIDKDQLQGIIDSFKEIGQSHPLIVRPANNSATSYILVSGEKRLLAAKELGWTEVEADVREVDEKSGKIIRLHENLKRFNLPWHEQVVLVEQLHVLRQAEHGVATRGRPEKDVPKVGWTIRDTADELSVGIGNLSEDLTLARAIRTNPRLLDIKDKKTAIRLVRDIATRQSAEVEAASPRATQLADQIFLGDSTAVLQQMPANSVDHCITDPPWISFFEAHRALDERTLPVFKELYRVLKNNAFLYIVCGLDDYDYYVGHNQPDPSNPSGRIHTKGQLERIGFTVGNTPIIWQKVNSLTRRGVRSWEYDRDFEFIIVAAKGAPALVTSRRLSGIKTFKIVHPTQMLHPHEKPLDLIEDILTDCSYENNLIIDPFAGSGVVGEACARLKRKYILIERDKASYDKIVKRLEGK